MTLQLNGRNVEAIGSLLDTVAAAGVALPHLCKDDNLPAIGACRTCLVEADGRIVAACSTPAVSASVVSTESERVRRIRRGVLELTAAMQAPRSHGIGGPLSNTAAEAYEAESVQAGRFAARHRGGTDTSSPFFSFQEDACILCARCVVACQDLQHIGAIGMAGSDRGTRVTPGPDTTFRDSICTSCGSCVAACPTDALRPRTGG